MLELDIFIITLVFSAHPITANVCPTVSLMSTRPWIRVVDHSFQVFIHLNVSVEKGHALFLGVHKIST